MNNRPLVARSLARALGETASARIFRTVVVAGAMLGAGACGGGEKKVEEPPAQMAPAPGPTEAELEAQRAAEEEAARKAEEQRVADEAAKQAEEAAAAKQAEEDAAAAKQAEEAALAAQKAEEEAAAKKATGKKRPRGKSSKPTGRGFILS